MAIKQSKQKRINDRGNVAVNFEIDPESHKKLVDLGNQEERTLSAVIRRIIRQYFLQAGI